MDTSSQGEMKWYLNALPDATKKALDFFSKSDLLKNSQWYLAGGTALALQFGHRESLDLDFFTKEKDFSQDYISSHLLDDGFKINEIKPGTLHGELFRVKVSFFVNPLFTPLYKLKQYGNVKVCDMRDIAAMKVIAVSQRGAKRDFIDLYCYVQKMESLSDVMLRLKEQYPDIAHNYHHMIKSMVFFNDANVEPMPRMLQDVSWTKVKSFFSKEVRKLEKIFL